ALDRSHRSAGHSGLARNAWGVRSGLRDRSVITRDGDACSRDPNRRIGADAPGAARFRSARTARTRIGRMRAFAAAALLLMLAIGAGIAVGGVSISLTDLWSGSGAAADTARLVVSLRIPRVALAALVGACLALSGAALQALLKNPLADPFLLGTSGGA